MPTIVDCQPWTGEVQVSSLNELLAGSSLGDAASLNLAHAQQWYVPTTDDTEELDACLKLLTDNEKRRADRFRHNGARQQFIVGHATIHILLQWYLQNEYQSINWKETEHHKPFIQLEDSSRPLEFNLSHCDGFIAVALGKNSQGIDVEKVRQLDDLEGISRQVFTESEISQVFSTNDPESQAHTFFKFWTCKEAALKADGTGFMKDPKSLELNFTSNPEPDIERVYWSDYIPGHQVAWTQRV